VDFEGGPKITFLAIMLEKNEKKKRSRSGSIKKQEFEIEI
jgi:hypothetical protein